MKATRSTAAKRLFKRLSALRATLPADERKILDELIVTEVEAHQMKGRNASRQAGRADGKEVGKQAGKAADRQVEAHQMKGRIATRQADRAAGKEVEAHQMKGRQVTRQANRAAEKQADKTATKTTFRIALDRDSEEYRIVD